VRAGWRRAVAASGPEFGLIRLAEPYSIAGLQHVCSQSQPWLFVEHQRRLGSLSPRKAAPAVDAIARLMQRPSDGRYVIVQLIGKYQNFHVG
jgi:hypothetical protein